MNPNFDRRGGLLIAVIKDNGIAAHSSASLRGNEQIAWGVVQEAKRKCRLDGLHR